MTLIRVDQALCTNCGLCMSVCPRGLLLMGTQGPQAATPSLCVACGHCVAICPVGALENSKAPLSKQPLLPFFPVLNKETAFLHLRSRRSIRSFQTAPVPRNTLLELMEIARFAPSGGNSQGISYIVVEQPEIISKLAKSTIEWMEEPAQKHSPSANVYSQYVLMYRQNGRDSILRNAPVLVLGTAAKNFARGRENTLLALEYVELYAPSLGLGTCWAGLLETAAFSGFKPLLEVLKIPAEKVLTGALLVGYPQFVFQRLVDRNPLDINFLAT